MSADFAERCFRQIEGFGEYGFPESHAAAFALLVYVSSWIKCHHPDIFACALLNSQPMGFYAPAQIVRDFRDHGGEAREVDINHSLWDCTLESCRLSARRTVPAMACRCGACAPCGIRASPETPPRHLCKHMPHRVGRGSPSSAVARTAVR